MGALDYFRQLWRPASVKGPRALRGSAWSTKSWRGALFAQPAAGPLLAGTTTHDGRDLSPPHGPGYATNLDVIVDLGQTPIALGKAGFDDAWTYVALSVQTLAAKLYRCQFALNPTAGFMATTVPSGGPSGGLISQDGNSFLLRTGVSGSGLVWAIEAAAVVKSGAVGEQIGGVSIESICHGAETL
jgi:hypothetical protein